jgi:hypothetical protein
MTQKRLLQVDKYTSTLGNKNILQVSRIKGWNHLGRNKDKKY